MKHSTKNKLFAGFIILTFALSSIAYVSNVLTGESPQQTAVPDSFVVEGTLNPELEASLVQRGFTSMRYYYTSIDNPLAGFVDALPYNTRTNTNQQQLIVQKIPANETYAAIIASSGSEDVRNVTQQNVMQALCRLLTVTPVTCLIMNTTG